VSFSGESTKEEVDALIHALAKAKEMLFTTMS
jgi:selenocysteine lyase/cysteine desulfurase